MDYKNFDDKLKNALERLEAPYESSAWAAFEQRLNAPFTEEQPAAVDAVDKAVFRTLERFEAPYQPAHWDMLATRMTHIARTRRRVWVAKLSEAAIFLLLLANLEGLLHSESAPAAPAPATPQIKSNRLQAEAPVRRSKSGNADTMQDALAGNLNSGDDMMLYGSDAGIGMSPAALPVSDGTFSGDQALALNQGADARAVSEAWIPLADLMPVPVVLPVGPVEQVNANPYAASTVNIKAPKQHRMYAATFASYDNNRVRSAGYSTNATGYGGGMAIGYRIGQWGMEAGLSYNRRPYEPKKEIEIYDGNTTNGFYGSYASNVDADIISMPFKVTRRVVRVGTTSAHAVAGVTANFVADKSYRYRKIFYPGVAPSGNQNPDQQPKLKQTGTGLLENGGNLNGNFYATADLGVRIEQPIGRRFAAFVEPAYRVALGNKGYGPNPARVSTLSVQAGVLATL